MAELRRRQLEQELTAASGEPYPPLIVRMAWFNVVAAHFMQEYVRVSREAEDLETQDMPDVARRQEVLQAQRLQRLRQSTATRLRDAEERLRAVALNQLHRRELEQLGADRELVAELARRHADAVAAPSAELRQEVEAAARLARTERAELDAMRRRCQCGEPASFIAENCGHLACARHSAAPCTCGGGNFCRFY